MNNKANAVYVVLRITYRDGRVYGTAIDRLFSHHADAEQYFTKVNQDPPYPMGFPAGFSWEYRMEVHTVI